MNIAIIDLGTNTFNLLICSIINSNYSILYSGKTSPKIGKGGIQNGILTKEAMQRGIKALEELHTIIQKHSCDTIIAKGTSALRNAKNASEFCSEVQSKFFITIDIIDGLQEAEYIFLGNTLAYNWGEKTALILDIGGGSNECIICTNSKILWKHSFENGMQRIISKFNPTNPMSLESINEIQLYLHETFEELFNQISHVSIDFLIGSSGPFDTFRAMLEYSKKEQRNSNPHYFITPHEMNEIYSQLVSSTKQEIANIPGMDMARVDLISVSACIVYSLINNLHITSIIQSDYSLKEGVMKSLLQ